MKIKTFEEHSGNVNENKDIFYRMSKPMANNEMYELKELIDSLYSNIQNGNDVNIAYWQEIKKLIQKLDEEGIVEVRKNRDGEFELNSGAPFFGSDFDYR